MSQKTEKPYCQFRGIKFYLYSSNECRFLPDLIDGLDPRDYIVDRWIPVSPEDKQLTTTLSARNLGWTQVDASPPVLWGLERWGELVPNDYREWFALAVLRPRLTNPELAVKLAASAPPVRVGPEEF